jgi:pSer/pThr/pTyr-binding forkhead associated (FHA) protein
MKAVFTYLTGGRAGQAVVIEKTYAMLGRAPQSDVRFGPDHDLPVSGRHAAVVFRDGEWILRDLASTNGTFINGVRITGEHQLADQDLIRLGDGGPMLRFSRMPGEWTPPPGDPVAPVPPLDVPLPVIPKTPVSTASADEGRFVAPVTATRKRAPVVAGFLVLTVLLSLGGVAIMRQRQTRGAVDERATLLMQADSLFAELEAMGSKASRLRGALDGAKAETARLRSRIRRAPQDHAVLAPLGDSLVRLSTSFERLAAAAALDVDQVAHKNEHSITLVRATWKDGMQRAGAAFAAQRDGRPVLLTTRSILEDSAGPPQTITIQLAGSDQQFKTRLIATHGSLDLAQLELPAGAGMGAAPGLSPRVGNSMVGQAAVLIGYGVSAATAGAPAPAATIATVNLVSDTSLQLESLGSTLIAGSPVFDRSGLVIGMLVNGAAGGDRLLSAIPAPALAAFLAGSPGDR